MSDDNTRGGISGEGYMCMCVCIYMYIYITTPSSINISRQQATSNKQQQQQQASWHAGIFAPVPARRVEIQSGLFQPRAMVVGFLNVPPPSPNDPPARWVGPKVENRPQTRVPPKRAIFGRFFAISARRVSFLRIHVFERKAAAAEADQMTSSSRQSDAWCSSSGRFTVQATPKIRGFW